MVVCTCTGSFLSFLFNACFEVNIIMPSNVSVLPHTDERATHKVFLRGLNVDAAIGVYDHEHDTHQPLKIDIEAEVINRADPLADQYDAEVLCYDKLAQNIRELATQTHTKLVETFAEKIISLMFENPLVTKARVRIEKPQAVAQAAAAGVEISRARA